MTIPVYIFAINSATLVTWYSIVVVIFLTDIENRNAGKHEM